MLVTNWVNRSDGTLVWQPGMEVHVKHMKRKDVPAWASAGDGRATPDAERTAADPRRRRDEVESRGGGGGGGAAVGTTATAVGVKRKSQRRRRRMPRVPGVPGGAEGGHLRGGGDEPAAKRRRRRRRRRARSRDGRWRAKDEDVEDEDKGVEDADARPMRTRMRTRMRMRESGVGAAVAGWRARDDIDGLDMDDDIHGGAAGSGRRPGPRKLKVSFASVVKKGLTRGTSMRSRRGACRRLRPTLIRVGHKQNLRVQSPVFLLRLPNTPRLQSVCVHVERNDYS